MKGLAAMAKTAKARTEKLKIEFSRNLEGPCGDNRRTFVDEIVMFTRLNAPLIGVRHWNHISHEVKKTIVDSVMVCLLPIFLQLQLHICWSNVLPLSNI